MNTFVRSALLAGTVVLAGCAGDADSMRSKGPHGSTAPITGQLTSIRYDVGPCHGFCPVYSVEVRADGTTTFVGQQHTQVDGKQTRQNGAQALTRLQHTLAPWQPVMDQQRESSDCGPRVTDMSHYTVTWTGRDGQQTTLLHDGGCRSDSAMLLTHLLREEIPQTLGISNWIGMPSSDTVTAPVN